MTMRMTSSVPTPMYTFLSLFNQGPFSTEPRHDQRDTGHQSGHAPDRDRRRSNE